MKFTRLKLTGFKSFCDPTELVLEPGLSGVVGPNGCGKSNLVEALRWVMGESSYKAMRASGMEDVIFSGSGGRASRNTAEVTLVLDNADRTAPAHLNTADILEVTRRIEREAGSVYRINGKEVRARDVQLLFADASTGAHSPALVRQGQIGELIAAKPQQRRALLEEAAGISGLHSRRHEAELRLRAAEQNLERVDDIIAQVEQTLETLKRQARLAIRYRALSADIRKAEATLFHLRWAAARFAEKDAQAAEAKLLRDLAETQHIELEAQKVLFLADKAIQPLRDEEAAAGAALQRFKLAAEQLEVDARRAADRHRELLAQSDQVAGDISREDALLEEIAASLVANADEADQLDEEIAAEAEAVETARAQLALSMEAVAVAEAEARAAGESLAQIRARRAAADRALGDARSRLSRAESEFAGIVRQVEQAEQLLASDEALAEKREARDVALELLQDLEARVADAESEVIAASDALDRSRPAELELENSLSRLDAESQTLTRILNAGGRSRYTPIVDSLTVEKGYEKALGAALGDDLEAPVDVTAPIHWSGATDANDPALPAGTDCLANHVSGAPALLRRLRQIGIIDPADAPRLMGQLAPGQRLVGRDGGLWRWDGLVASANAPTAAAERLRQRNRLAELAAEIATCRAERDALRAAASGLQSALDAARLAERSARDAARQAGRDLQQLQQDVDRLERQKAEHGARLSALTESRERSARLVSESRAALDETSKGLADLPGEDAALGHLRGAEAHVRDLRSRADHDRATLGQLETTGRLRANRRVQLGSERQSLERRRAGALAQKETLRARLAQVTAQIAAVTATPEDFAAQRDALLERIASASEAHLKARETLAAAENRLREADRTQRDAANALAAARAEAARLEERISGLGAQRQQIEQLVIETLGISAHQTAAMAGIRPEQPLPDAMQVEKQLDRLKAERERLGGVNLGAEREAEETREKLDLMVKDRDDLVEAIAKLRAGIQSLNREGRQRLAEAFARVNGHFQELFTSLFGGGTAELQFVESDDPLEAGLEILARPPGKKPSTMTLLSGGEQALTAMSLIFAVFLTNPAPICVLDEVDAPLDDHNVERFCNLLDMMSQRTQTRFLVITHNPITMARVDRLFGVTMAERGVSQLVSVDLNAAVAVVRQAG